MCQIARYLPHHRSENASKTHPKSSHDKFKTASKNKQFKEDQQTLIEKTAAAIRNLTDEEMALFLHKKWIDPIVKGIDDTLDALLSTLESKVLALGKKYAVSYQQLNEELETAQKKLARLIDELTGDEYAIIGLKKL